MAISPQTQSWLAQLKAQPWFSQVEQTFKSYGIADQLWESTLAVEDSGLDPAIIITDSNGYQSVGLFQLNKDGIGKNYANGVLQNPVTNALLAARAMASRIATDGNQNADLPTQLTSIELAGWPGNDAKLPQNTTRQAALAAITGGSATDSSDWLIPPIPALGFPGLAKNPFYAGQDSIPPAITGGPGQAPSFPSTEQINSWILNATIAAVLLGLLAGGFTLLAAPSVEAAAEHVPIPA